MKAIKLEVTAQEVELIIVALQTEIKRLQIHNINVENRVGLILMMNKKLKEIGITL